MASFSQILFVFEKVYNKTDNYYKEHEKKDPDFREPEWWCTKNAIGTTEISRKKSIYLFF